MNAKRPTGILRRASIVLIAAATAAAVLTSGASASSEAVVGSANSGAYAEQVKGPVSSGPLPNVVAPPGGAASAVGVNLPNVLRTGILNAAASTGNLGTSTGFSKSSASAADVKVGNNLWPALAADLVTSRCRADANGVSGSSELTNLRIRLGGILVLQAKAAMPNTVVNVPGVAKIVLNEQIKGDDAITVNAVHVTLLGALPGLTEDIILSQSRCSATKLAPPPNCTGTSLFDHASAPEQGTSYNDFQATELGVKVIANARVRICAVVFYKAEGVTGRVDVRLWNTNGIQYTGASGFVDASAPAAWVVVNLSTAVDLAVGEEAVASYNTPGAYWAVPRPGPWPVAKPAITGSGAAYAYGAIGTFPSTSSGANYYVDVIAIALP